MTCRATCKNHLRAITPRSERGLRCKTCSYGCISKGSRHAGECQNCSTLLHIRTRVFQQGFLTEEGSMSQCCSGQCFSQLCALEHFHTPVDGATGIPDGHTSLGKPLKDAN